MEAPECSEAGGLLLGLVFKERARLRRGRRMQILAAHLFGPEFV